MAELQSSVRTVYHIKDGPTSMYLIDANHAVGNFPDEWSNDPWPDEEPEGSDKNAVEIPSGWATLSIPDRRALAVRLGAPRNVKVADADKVIAKELADRASASETTKRLAD